MARTIDTIHSEILTAISSNTTLSPLLTSTSTVARFRVFTYIAATAIWILETLFDTHKSEVDVKLKNQKAGTLPWYREMALAFQYGFALVTDHDYYDNSGFSDAEVAQSKIVKYAAVSQSETETRVIIKIAGETDGELAPITEPQKASFDTYIKDIRWPVKITVINYKPDLLSLYLKVKYDGLVLNATGMSIINGNYPVKDALSEFMKELPFNGELRLSALVDKIQLVDGVEDVTLISSSSKWIEAESNDYGEAQEIFISTIAQSGYFKIENLNIDYYNNVV